MPGLTDEEMDDSEFTDTGSEYHPTTDDGSTFDPADADQLNLLEDYGSSGHGDDDDMGSEGETTPVPPTPRRSSGYMAANKSTSYRLDATVTAPPNRTQAGDLGHMEIDDTTDLRCAQAVAHGPPQKATTSQPVPIESKNHPGRGSEENVRKVIDLKRIPHNPSAAFNFKFKLPNTPSHEPEKSAHDDLSTTFSFIRKRGTNALDDTLDQEPDTSKKKLKCAPSPRGKGGGACKVMLQRMHKFQQRVRFRDAELKEGRKAYERQEKKIAGLLETVGTLGATPGTNIPDTAEAKKVIADLSAAKQEYERRCRALNGEFEAKTKILLEARSRLSDETRERYEVLTSQIQEEGGRIMAGFEKEKSDLLQTVQNMTGNDVESKQRASQQIELLVQVSQALEKENRVSRTELEKFQQEVGELLAERKETEKKHNEFIEEIEGNLTKLLSDQAMAKDCMDKCDAQTEHVKALEADIRDTRTELQAKEVEVQKIRGEMDGILKAREGYVQRALKEKKDEMREIYKQKEAKLRQELQHAADKEMNETIRLTLEVEKKRLKAEFDATWDEQADKFNKKFNQYLKDEKDKFRAKTEEEKQKMRQELENKMDDALMSKTTKINDLKTLLEAMKKTENDLRIERDQWRTKALSMEDEMKEQTQITQKLMGRVDELELQNGTSLPPPPSANLKEIGFPYSKRGHDWGMDATNHDAGPSAYPSFNQPSNQEDSDVSPTAWETMGKESEKATEKSSKQTGRSQNDETESESESGSEADKEDNGEGGAKKDRDEIKQVREGEEDKKKKDRERKNKTAKKKEISKKNEKGRMKESSKPPSDNEEEEGDPNNEDGDEMVIDSGWVKDQNGKGKNQSKTEKAKENSKPKPSSDNEEEESDADHEDGDEMEINSGGGKDRKGKGKEKSKNKKGRKKENSKPSSDNEEEESDADPEDGDEMEIDGVGGKGRKEKGKEKPKNKKGRTKASPKPSSDPADSEDDEKESDTEDDDDDEANPYLSPKERAKKKVQKEKAADTRLSRHKIVTFVRAVIKKACHVNHANEHVLDGWDANMGLKYAKGTGPGPDEKKIQLDMTGKISSKWNQTVLRMLTERAMEGMSSEKTLPARSPEYIQDIISKYMTRARGAWKKTRPRMKEDGTMEGGDELEARMLRENDEKAKMMRVSTRRGQRYRDRVRTLESIIAFKKKNPRDHPDIPIYESLLDLVKSLGKKGMSSDESDVDVNTGEHIYFVKKIPWRAPGVDEEMDLIDRQKNKKGNAKVRRGSKPTKRVRTNNGSLSQKLPPKGIKKDLINQGWLKNFATPEDLDLSQKPFRWVGIGPARPKGKSRDNQTLQQ